MGFDGAILTPPIADHLPVLDELERAGTPYVRIQPGTEVERGASVSIDNTEAARRMTRHLIDLGHRRIGFIIGHKGFPVSEQRLGGYLDALREMGVPLDGNLLQQGWFDFQSGQAAAETLLDLKQSPTAIFASSDDMAAGALSVAMQRGMRVPQDLSIAGFDDTPLASLVWPGITTMRQPFEDMAAKAADLLFAGSDERVVLASDLVERGSTSGAA